MGKSKVEKNTDAKWSKNMKRRGLGGSHVTVQFTPVIFFSCYYHHPLGFSPSARGQGHSWCVILHFLYTQLFFHLWLYLCFFTVCHEFVIVFVIIKYLYFYIIVCCRQCVYLVDTGNDFACLSSGIGHYGHLAAFIEIKSIYNSDYPDLSRFALRNIFVINGEKDTNQRK